MLIRPYTISQMVILLMTIFLLLYLRDAMHRTAAANRPHIRWMLEMAGWGAGIILITLLAGVAEFTAIDLLTYFRSVLILLFWRAMAQAIYALPPAAPFARRDEARWSNRAFGALLVLELGFLAVHWVRFAQTGAMAPRPVLMGLPVLIAGLWSVLLVARKLWAAEQAPGLTRGEQWRRAALAPQSALGPFYRWFLLAMGGLLLLNPLFNPAIYAVAPPPLWMMIAGDLLVTGALMLALFGYLSSSPALASLAYRLVGAGLTIYFVLISILGWIVTVTFLRQQAPAVSPAAMFGAQMQAQFFVTPAAYHPLAEQLSNLLTPLLWFAVAGSLLFGWAYSFYYRGVVQPPLRQIIDGFRQVEQERLDVRIPPLPWQDEFSQIVVSFNQMAASLEHSHRQVRAYQQHLQELVDQRTAKLQQEMELRKGLEVRQAIQDERTRIAQETHDGLLQSLMGVRIRLMRGRRLSQLPAGRLQTELEEMAGEITHSVQDLRKLINELNDQILPNGLLPALQQAIQRHERAYAVTVHQELECAAPRLAVNDELQILRIVQEALANAARHSGAATASVAVRCPAEAGGRAALHVCIGDSGRGFDPARLSSAGWGLKNMQQRAAQINATLAITSAPGAGTTVRLVVPLGEGAAGAGQDVKLDSP